MTQLRIFASSTILTAAVAAGAHAVEPETWRPHVTYSPSITSPAPSTFAAPAPGCGTCEPPAITPLPATPTPVFVEPAPATVVYRPVVEIAPAQTAYAGRGILGQPKLYVPGQPVRNFLRYISP